MVRSDYENCIAEPIRIPYLLKKGLYCGICIGDCLLQRDLSFGKPVFPLCGNLERMV